MRANRATEHDLIVVGLGGIGSAAACWSALGGHARILGLEQFDLDHPHGASDDVSRIIRLSYHRPDYVRLARRAYEAWADIEARTGRRIVTRTGGLDLFPAAGAIPAIDYTASMTAEGVPFDTLDAATVRRAWPQWRIDDDTVGLFQAESGITDPSQGNAAHRELAIEAGATLLPRTRVTAIRDQGGEAVVETADGGRHAGDRVVIAADAWTNELLRTSFGLDLPLTVTQEQVAWFEPADPASFEAERFPIWIWMDDPSFYGFPTHGAPGPKIGQDVGGQEVTPATRSYEPDGAALARLDAFRERHLPGLGPRLRAKTCLYTLTPDRDFVVDTVPGHPNVLVVLGAAHAFKYASILGRVAAAWADGGTAPSEAGMESFTFTRNALVDRDTAARFLV